jgi:hypothetical protein
MKTTYDDAELRPFGAAVLRLITSGEGYEEISRKIGYAATQDILGRPQLKGNLPKTILAEKALKLIRSKKRLSDYDIEGLRALATDLGLMKSQVLRKNPVSKKDDRPWFWVDEDYATIHTYSKDWRPTGDCRYFTEAHLRNMVKTLEKDGYVQRENPSIKIEKDASEASKRLESFYARKNPRGSKDHWFYIDSEKMQIHTAAGGDHPSKTYNYEDEEEFLADIARFKADGYKFMKDQASRPRKFRVTRTNPVISLEEYQP